MTAHSTLDEITRATKAVDALLSALAGNPSAGAAAAYRAAIRRHGVSLLDQAGPEALAAVLARIKTDATDRAQAEARERIVREVWSDLLASREAA